jgi:hypothetical protein
MTSEEIKKHIEDVVEPISSKTVGRKEGIDLLLVELVRGVWEIAHHLSLPSVGK